MRLYNVNLHLLLGQDQVNPYTAQTLNPISRIVVQKNKPVLKTLGESNVVDVPGYDRHKRRQFWWLQ